MDADDVKLDTHGFLNLLEGNGKDPSAFKKCAYPGVDVRYFVLPLGGDYPEKTPPEGTRRAEGEKFMDEIIEKAGKEPRTFFEEGGALPFAVLAPNGKSA